MLLKNVCFEGDLQSASNISVEDIATVRVYTNEGTKKYTCTKAGYFFGTASGANYSTYGTLDTSDDYKGTFTTRCFAYKANGELVRTVIDGTYTYSYSIKFFQHLDVGDYITIWHSGADGSSACSSYISGTMIYTD